MTNTDKHTQPTVFSAKSDGSSPLRPALRIRAEKVTGKISTLPLETIEALPPKKIQEIIHELEVHQVELSLQNEELRRAQLNLEVERARYADLYHHAPVGYCTLDEKGLFLESNRTMASLLGAAPGTLKRQPFTRFIFKEDQDIYYLHTKKLTETDKPQGFELRMQQKNKTVFWAHLVGTVMPHVSGRLEYRLVIDDVTERKMATFALRESEAQLVQAKKMESVGRLAGGIAHDFNNMLGVILASAELAEAYVGKDSKLFENLLRIKKAAQHAADLTQRLLGFARKQVIVPRVLDINETIEELLKMLRYLIGKHIRLTWMPGTSLWPVRIDPSQVEQILTNLCINARDAVPENGNIRIEARNVTLDAVYCDDHPDLAPGEYVELMVSDDGIGIDPKALDSIYEPFFTTKTVPTGAGLGLSSVYGIVMQNQGRISVSSELGQGTTFRIYLPRHVNPGAGSRP
jgi:two-component system sensor histidine kinase EvgS